MRPTQEDTGLFDSLLAYAASKLRSGHSPDDLRADLMGRGVAEQLADRVIEEARAGNRRTGLFAGVKYLLIGLVCLALGTGITAATYTRASRAGGSYWITIGLFGFGVGYTVGGIVRMITAANRGK
ncbi:MAG: hypothetical protein NT080_10930 [Spirochaetes bacterium]|nr:hypothetical protein [Spirochaetota bacterium]